MWPSARRAVHLWLAMVAGVGMTGLSACSTQGKQAPAGAASPGLSQAAGVGSGATSQTAQPLKAATPGTAPSVGGTPAAAPFEQVIKGAQRQDGLLPIWRQQDKIWIELHPSTLGKPFFLSPRLSTGIGEAGVFGGMLQSRWTQVGRPQWVMFRQVNQQVQLVAVNAIFTARPGSPQARAVANAFSPSLLASVPVASGPQASSGAVLIDASALMLTDMLGMAAHLQRSYRQNYALDGRNSALLRATPTEKALVFEVLQHFATGSITSGSNTPGTPGPSVPTSVPDPRSLFVTAHYTLTPLPDTPMPTRPADARVGYFASTVADFTDDLARTPRLRHINRWRLDKKDPQAALSEPVQPIVYWLDPSIPEAYRPAITAGVLAWNKAFEAIGFRNAIEVRTAPADQPVDAMQPGHATIRWMTNSQPAFGAIGPTHVDPRTGEILTASIALESLSSRAMRTTRSQFLAHTHLPPGIPLAQAPDPMGAAPPDHASEALGHSPETCLHADHAAEQLDLALDVLHARGVLDPDSPQVQDFVLAYLKDVTMHEVGHTLGLRHNFKASRWRTQQELEDPVLGLAQGNSASVMDYMPINLPAPGKRGGTPFQTTLGPYDHWAIEYGYKPLPEDPAQAQAALRTIALRADDPAWADVLAFGTDEDRAEGLDPQALAFDLGKDPIAHARVRLAIVRELFEGLSSPSFQSGDDASLARRRVGYGLREMARTSQLLLRQIGGLVVRRNGPASGLDLLEPLPARQQRAALLVLLREFLAPDALGLTAKVQRRLATDFLDRQELSVHGQSAMLTDFSWAGQQLALQRAILTALMDEKLAERLLDNIDKTRDAAQPPLTPKALHGSLRQAIWSGQTWPAAQAGARRNLQREHVKQLAGAIVRQSSERADVRATLRDEARQLLQHLRAVRHTRDSAEAAHRRDCVDTLARALSASVVRTTP